MTDTDINALVERLEKAAGPDRDLGREVLLAGGWTKTCIGHFYGPLYQWRGPQGQSFSEDALPCPMRSLDAAVTLVPEGWSRQQRTAEHHENGFIVELWRSWGPDAYKRITAHHASERTALCIAALRARSAMEREDGT